MTTDWMVRCLEKEEELQRLEEQFEDLRAFKDSVLVIQSPDPTVTVRNLIRERDSLKEQLQALQRDDSADYGYKARFELVREQLVGMREQLEAVREALEWCNDHRDSERFHSVAESALNRVPSPASES